MTATTIPGVSEAVRESCAYLVSDAALASIKRDPYWPKWDSPWWHMLLLHEMELTDQIPAVAVATMTSVMKTHYLPVFPLRIEEIPAGVDPYRNILCLCALGSMFQVLSACGVDLDAEIPWLREWLLRYQLPDGGYNCDEAAYTKETPKSSIVSTLPCLEALLYCTRRPLTAEETAVLDRGAAYILRQRLFRRVSSGGVIDPDWLEIRFPRFYEYDFLRGFAFLAAWREHSGFVIPDDLADEVAELVARQWTSEGIVLRRYNLFDKRSQNPQPDGSWSSGPASEFPLLQAISAPNLPCEPLTRVWRAIGPHRREVRTAYECVYKNPLKLRTGDLVRIEKREVEPEWLGWVFGVDAHGVGGWLPAKYLAESPTEARLTRDYDATELTVSPGDHVTVYFTESGWCWCRDTAGHRGWVPANVLSSCL